MRRRGIIGWILNSMIWKQLIIRPFFNILIVFLALFHGNLWRAIIAITLIFRLVLIKFTSASVQMSHNMSDIQPKLNEIQEKYKDDPNRMAEETMKIFKKEWKSPFKWCLRLLIQLPIFAWLYWVIYCMVNWRIEADWLYSFFYSFWNKFISEWIDWSWSIITTFYWIDLLASKNLVLAIITAVLMFFQTKLTTLIQPKQKAQKLPNWQAMPDPSKMMWAMSRMMAFMMRWMVYVLPSAIWLYMVVTALFSICQYTRQYRSLLRAKRLEFRDKPTIVQG